MLTAPARRAETPTMWRWKSKSLDASCRKSALNDKAQKDSKDRATPLLGRMTSSIDEEINSAQNSRQHALLNDQPSM